MAIREGGDADARREVWGPRGTSVPGVVGLREWGPDLLRRVEAVTQRLGLPVQAVRGDRVLSREHLWVAVEHHARGVRHARAGALDPGVDFLRYAAAHRQIARAVEALGVPLDTGEAQNGRVPVLLVALGDVDARTLLEVAEAEGLQGVVLESEPVKTGSPDNGFRFTDGARRYWGKRLGLSPDGSRDRVQARLFAAMALVALDVRVSA